MLIIIFAPSSGDVGVMVVVIVLHLVVGLFGQDQKSLFRSLLVKVPVAALVAECTSYAVSAGLDCLTRHGGGCTHKSVHNKCKV